MLYALLHREKRIKRTSPLEMEVLTYVSHGTKIPSFRVELPSEFKTCGIGKYLN